MLRDRIVEAMQDFDLDTPVKRIQIGLIYSAVQLINGSTGVAFTFPRTGCGLELGEEKPLTGRPAGDLIIHLGGKNLTSSSLALAAINALISSRVSYRKEDEGDILEKLDIRMGDRVCMVGCFLPVMEKLKRAISGRQPWPQPIIIAIISVLY